MGVIGQWRRSALGAGGVALLLPLALAGAAGLTTALGGRATLRALGQVVAGPDAPARLANPRADSPGDVPPVPVRRPRARVRAGSPTPAQPAVATVRPSPGASPRAPRGGAPSAGRPPSDGAVGPGSSGGGAGGSAGGGTGGSGGGGQPPERTPLHDAAQGVADRVPAVPGPVGETAADAVQTVVDLIP